MSHGLYQGAWRGGHTRKLPLAAQKGPSVSLGWQQRGAQTKGGSRWGQASTARGGYLLAPLPKEIMKAIHPARDGFQLPLVLRTLILQLLPEALLHLMDKSPQINGPWGLRGGRTPRGRAMIHPILDTHTRVPVTRHRHVQWRLWKGVRGTKAGYGQEGRQCHKRAL